MDLILKFRIYQFSCYINNSFLQLNNNNKNQVRFNNRAVLYYNYEISHKLKLIKSITYENYKFI